MCSVSQHGQSLRSGAARGGLTLKSKLDLEIKLQISMNLLRKRNTEMQLCLMLTHRNLEGLWGQGCQMPAASGLLC